MDQQTKEKTLENLTKSENILVVAAESAGFDGIAAGLALYLSLSKLGKNVVILAQSPTAGDAQRLYAIDQIGKVGGSKNPVIVIKDAVATVDKVTYFLDGDKLKVVIHPLPGSKGVSPDQMSTEYTTAQPNLIFTLGFDNLSTLEKEIPHEHKITSDTWVVNISRRQSQQKFAQHEYFDPQSGSISEVTTSVLQDLALPLDEDIAYNLYAGIADSTNNFAPANTSAKTFEIAGWLVKFGAGKASLAGLGQPSPTPKPQIAPQFGQFAPRFPSQPKSAFPPPRPPMTPFNPADFFDQTAPIEEVESAPETAIQEKDSKDWLKPPKIYKGSKSFGEGKE